MLRCFHQLQLSVLSILTTTVSTLSEKKTPDSLEAIESVGAGVMENIGNVVSSSKQIFSLLYVVVVHFLWIRDFLTIDKVQTSESGRDCC